MCLVVQGTVGLSSSNYNLHYLFEAQVSIACDPSPLDMDI